MQLWLDAMAAKKVGCHRYREGAVLIHGRSSRSALIPGDSGPCRFDHYRTDLGKAKILWPSRKRGPSSKFIAGEKRFKCGGSNAEIIKRKGSFVDDIVLAHEGHLGLRQRRLG